MGTHRSAMQLMLLCAIDLFINTITKFGDIVDNNCTFRVSVVSRSENVPLAPLRRM